MHIVHLLKIRFQDSHAVRVEQEPSLAAAMKWEPDLCWTTEPCPGFATIDLSLDIPEFKHDNYAKTPPSPGWFETQSTALAWLLRNE